MKDFEGSVVYEYSSRISCWSGIDIVRQKSFRGRMIVVSCLLAGFIAMSVSFVWAPTGEEVQDIGTYNAAIQEVQGAAIEGTTVMLEGGYSRLRQAADVIRKSSVDMLVNLNMCINDDKALQENREPTTRLPVLAYHQVLSEQLYYPIHASNPWVLSERAFEAQMRYLYEQGFTTINSAQLIGFLHYGEELPPNAIMITFDDGYLDNAVYAHPVMQQFGFTGIIFVITSFIADEPGELRAYPAQFMSIADMERVSDVFEFGSHSHDMHHRVDGHPALLVESFEAIQADLLKSFEHDLISISAGFAYPFGRHGADVVAALRQENIPFAFATHFGYVEQGLDVFRLPRFSITSGVSKESFSDMVSGVWER